MHFIDQKKKKNRERETKWQRMKQGRREDCFWFSMNLIILIWNVRGANNRNKRKIIKSLIKDHRVDLVCLQETKIQEMSTTIVRSLGVGRFLDWVALDSNGAAGSILIFWDNRVLNRLGVEMGEFLLSCRFKNGIDGLTLVFTRVYGPGVATLENIFGRSWGLLGVYGRILGV